MDTKKVLQQLIKIADNQQKIINKLAQAQPVMEPQRLEPNKTTHDPAGALLNALPPAVKPLVAKLEARDSDMLLTFQQGKATQPNYDAVLRTMQTLTNQGVLQQKYNLKVV
jgi:hypothetical protein